MNNKYEIVRNRITSIGLQKYADRLAANEEQCPLYQLQLILADPEAKDADRIAAAKTILSFTWNKAPTEKFIATVEKEEVPKEKIMEEITNLLNEMNTKSTSEASTKASIKTGPLAKEEYL